MTTLKSLVDEWLRMDQNQASRAEVQQLWDDRNIAELEKRMQPRIEFGTAGLRGKMEAGWARMNDLIIIQASQGLCSYVLSVVPDAINRGIVVGHDHRHNSERWANLTAGVFISNGVKVYLHRGLVHTPMVPFSVKRLNAACGVMITASHNPKQDNGYKVYWENAVQIIGPHDTGISAAIQENLVPKSWNINSASACLDKTQEMCEAYYAMLASQNPLSTPETPTNVRFVNTSMHGVGHAFVVKAFKVCGLSPVVPVGEQQEPDPEFPTVKFPNPEEKGALNLALKTADAEGITHVLAQDPDADRFSAAEKDSSSGHWTTFTGDQLGTLFAYDVFLEYKRTGKPLNKLAMVASTVSSKMVESMALKEGFKFVDCLTGFKYIGNTALDLVKDGYFVPFGYEEAIGFMFGDEVRDKDGVAASIRFARMVEALTKEGKTVLEHLRALYSKYGFFQTSNSYFVCTDTFAIDSIFARIRNFPGTTANPPYPTHIGGLQISRIVDLTTGHGYDSNNPPSLKPSLPLSSGHMIQLRAEQVGKTNGSPLKISLTIRTSGTEPKIKYYLEGSADDPAAVGKLLPEVVQDLRDNWMEASKHNLGMP